MIWDRVRLLVVCGVAILAGVAVSIPASAVGASGKTGRVAAAPGVAGDLAVIAGRTRTVQPGSATASPLWAQAVAVASNGDLYIADPGNEVVEKVTPAGDLSIIAGVAGRWGAPTPGLATSSDLDGPSGVAVDSTGDVYIADSSNDVVEKVTPAGDLSIIAGTGSSGSPTRGPATSSDLLEPTGVAVDTVGDVFIADRGNDVVEKVTTAGDLSVIAGVSDRFGTPTPGPATSSDLYDPSGVAVDAEGNVYIADFQSSDVEKVSPAGTLSVFAGTSSWGSPTPGLATSSDLGFPSGVAVDASGNVYVADSFNDVVEKVASLGALSIVAGTSSWGAPTPGPATSSALVQPYGVAVDASGNVYIADTYNNEVEKVTPSGTLSIIAGTGSSGAPTPGLATSSDLDRPRALAVDSEGNVYIADSGNDVVEKVTPSGSLSIFARDSALGIAVDSSDNVYIADGEVEKATPSGATSVIAGTYGATAVAVDSSGNLYIADPSESVVEKITRSGKTTIIAGTGISGSPTSGAATSSELDRPSAVAVDRSGDVYISDTNNSVVEEVSPSGMLSIVAGTGVFGTPTPGPATSSNLKDTSEIAIDASGDLYIADPDNLDIEEVFAATSGSGTTTTGTDTTTTGTGTTTTGTKPTKTYTPPTVAQVLKSLAPTLAPSGAGAKIEKLLKAGGFTTSFQAPSPGVLSIVWQVTVLRNHRKSVVTIASGTLTTTGVGAYTVKVTLAAAGRRDLQSVRSLKITVKSSFTPKGAKQTTASKSVTLKR